jgi:hypothetical protein
MITEDWILAELPHAMRVRKFRCNPNFRDHVRNDVAEMASLAGVARVTDVFALRGAAG